MSVMCKFGLDLFSERGGFVLFARITLEFYIRMSGNSLTVSLRASHQDFLAYFKLGYKLKSSRVTISAGGCGFLSTNMQVRP